MGDHIEVSLFKNPLGTLLLSTVFKFQPFSAKEYRDYLLTANVVTTATFSGLFDTSRMLRVGRTGFDSLKG
jgi:hypothetical protein